MTRNHKYGRRMTFCNYGGLYFPVIVGSRYILKKDIRLQDRDMYMRYSQKGIYAKNRLTN